MTSATSNFVTSGSAGGGLFPPFRGAGGNPGNGSGGSTPSGNADNPPVGDGNARQNFSVGALSRNSSGQGPNPLKNDRNSLYGIPNAPTHTDSSLLNVNAGGMVPQRKESSPGFRGGESSTPKVNPQLTQGGSTVSGDSGYRYPRNSYEALGTRPSTSGRVSQPGAGLNGGNFAVPSVDPLSNQRSGTGPIPPSVPSGTAQPVNLASGVLGSRGGMKEPGGGRKEDPSKSKSSILGVRQVLPNELQNFPNPFNGERNLFNRDASSFLSALRLKLPNGYQRPTTPQNVSKAQRVRSAVLGLINPTNPYDTLSSTSTEGGRTQNEAQYTHARQNPNIGSDDGTIRASSSDEVLKNDLQPGKTPESDQKRQNRRERLRYRLRRAAYSSFGGLSPTESLGSEDDSSRPPQDYSSPFPVSGANMNSRSARSSPIGKPDPLSRQSDQNYGQSEEPSQVEMQPDQEVGQNQRLEQNQPNNQLNNQPNSLQIPTDSQQGSNAAGRRASGPVKKAVARAAKVAASAAANTVKSALSKIVVALGSWWPVVIVVIVLIILILVVVFLSSQSNTISATNEVARKANQRTVVSANFATFGHSIGKAPTEPFRSSSDGIERDPDGSVRKVYLRFFHKLPAGSQINEYNLLASVSFPKAVSGVFRSDGSQINQVESLATFVLKGASSYTQQGLSVRWGCNRSCGDATDAEIVLREPVDLAASGNQIKISYAVSDITDVNGNLLQSSNRSVELCFDINNVYGCESGRSNIGQVVSEQSSDTAQSSVTSIGMSCPINKIQGMVCTSRFGVARSVGSGKHDGVDISYGPGSSLDDFINNVKVLSPVDGTIIAISKPGQEISIGGRYFLIRDDRNSEINYLIAHIHPNSSPSKLGVNSKVRRGDILGYPFYPGQGLSNAVNRGYWTGPHIHFEVRKNNTPIDPEKYVSEACSWNNFKCP